MNGLPSPSIHPPTVCNLTLEIRTTALARRRFAAVNCDRRPTMSYQAGYPPPAGQQQAYGGAPPPPAYVAPPPAYPPTQDGGAYYGQQQQQQQQQTTTSRGGDGFWKGW